MSDDFNKLELLIKMMGMTGSDNENQALVAIRKANSILAAEGWDWDRLLRGKVKLIADPFASRPAAPAPQAKPATMQRAPSPPPPPPPTYAPNPWPQGAAPKPKPQPAYAAAPKPASPSPQAKAAPLHFRRSSTGEWCIASYLNIDGTIGQKVHLEKRDGSKSQEVMGTFVEQDPQGYYLYKIAKATKWKNRFADQSGIGDIV